MSLSLSVLGSGSGGNCTLVVLHDRAEPRNILIDAGLSPRDAATAVAAVLAEKKRAVYQRCQALIR